MRALPRTATRLLGWILLGVLGLPGAAAAQFVRGRPASIELRPSASLPLGDFGKASPGLGAGAGAGGAVTVHVPVTPRFAVYGGYDYERFGCGECGAAGFEGHLPEAGFEAGLEAIFPGRLGRADPWLSAGILIHRRLEIPQGGDGFSSSSSTGWSVAAGVRLPIAPSLGLRPGIRYRAYSATFVFPDLGFGLLGASGTFERKVDVTSISLEVGLSVELPLGS